MSILVSPALYVASKLVCPRLLPCFFFFIIMFYAFLIFGDLFIYFLPVNLNDP